jgi:hypothetical protein
MLLMPAHAHALDLSISLSFDIGSIRLSSKSTCHVCTRLRGAPKGNVSKYTPHTGLTPYPAKAKLRSNAYAAVAICLDQ